MTCENNSHPASFLEEEYGFNFSFGKAVETDLVIAAAFDLLKNAAQSYGDVSVANTDFTYAESINIPELLSDSGVEERSLSLDQMLTGAAAAMQVEFSDGSHRMDPGEGKSAYVYHREGNFAQKKYYFQINADTFVSDSDFLAHSLNGYDGISYTGTQIPREVYVLSVMLHELAHAYTLNVGFDESNLPPWNINGYTTSGNRNPEDHDALGHWADIMAWEVFRAAQEAGDIDFGYSVDYSCHIGIGSSVVDNLQSRIFPNELGAYPRDAPSEFESSNYGDIGTAIGRLLANGGDPDDGKWGDGPDNYIANFFGSNLKSQPRADPNLNPAGFLSSLLVAELLDSLSDAIGIDPNGNDVEQYLHERLGTVLDDLVYETAEEIINKTFNTFNFNLPEANPLGLRYGRELASKVVDIKTEAGAFLSAAGSYVGAAYGTKIGASIGSLGGPIGAAIGAFIGGVLGAVFGNLLGRRKPKIPSASANTVLSFQDGMYVLGSVTSQNNGNEDYVTDLANFAADGLNDAIAVIKGSGLNGEVINTYSPTQTYGHTANQVYVTIGGQTHNVNAGVDALDIGTMYALKRTEIAGGNLYMKRAVRNSTAQNLVAMSNDLQTAGDFATYKRNQDIIDGAIAAPYNSLSEADKAWYGNNEAVLRNIQRSGHQPLSAADQTWWDNNAADVDRVLTTLNTVSTFAAGWIITLQRAGELGLNKSAVSDFYGGAKGFVDSLQGIINAPLDYENVAFSLDGQDLKVIRDSNADGVIDAGEDTVFNERGFLNAAGHADGGVGYNLSISNATMTTGNDIIIGASGTVDDLTSQTVTRPGHRSYGRTWIPGRTVVVDREGGDDIIIGDSGANMLYGRSGDDWLDGGAGADKLYGGVGDDVLIGRSGADKLYGEAGDDVLIGGTGLDRVYGGAGNDTIIRSAENGLSYGGAGDDLLIATQGTGYAGHFRGGVGTEDAGNDTISFERYSEGITLDMRYRSASWDGHSSAFYSNPNVRRYMVRSNDTDNALINYMFVSQIDNVTGTSFADVINGDNANNILRGGGGDDVLKGNGGSDTLEGGAGADTLERTKNSSGAWGTTTVSYEHSLGGVDVSIGHIASLGGQHAFGGDASGDKFVGYMHHLTGSNYADVLEGNYGSNVLRGLDGDDYFIATRGSDQFHGGEGFDTVDYGNHTGTAGLTINIRDGQYTSGYVNGVHAASGSSRSWGVEHAVGTDKADSIIAGDGDNVLEGGKGNDKLYGGAGNDVYFVELGGGNDTIYEPNTRNLSSVSGAFGGLIRNLIASTTKSAGHDTIMVGYADGLSWDNVFIGGGTNLTVHVNGQTLATAINSPNDKRELVGIDAIDIGGVGAVDIWYMNYGASKRTTYGATGQIVYGDHPNGSARRNLLQGTQSNDIIYAAGSATAHETESNILHGRRGNDTIYASTGDDQYIFDRGSGRDTVRDSGGLDHVQFGPGVASSDLVFTVVGNDLYIGIAPKDAEDTNALKANLMTDYIRVVGGGTLRNGSVYSGTLLEYITVDNVNIDIRTLDVNWTVTRSGLIGSGGSNTGGGYRGGTRPNRNIGSYYNIPPLMFDLDGDGLELVSVNESRIVARGADRSLTRIGWLGADDGFLALDRNGNGKIDSLSEVSFAQDLEGAVTDLEGLRAYDSNSDGMFDASDERFAEFRIWRDLNQNGRGSKRELMTLETAGITSINLNGTSTGNDIENYADSVVLNTTEYTRSDGTVETAYDVALAASVIRDGRETASVDMTVDEIILEGRLGRIGTRRLERLIARNERRAETALDTTVAPIVIDVNGDGELALTHLTQSGVKIDVDNNGHADRIGWVGAADGLLGLDRNADGLITAVSEISFLQDVEDAATDLEGLAAFDSNGNGLLDAGDARWDDFKVWQDANQDGVSQASELVTLDIAGLTSINLSAHTGQEAFGGDSENTVFGLTAVEWGDGRTGVAGDVGLRVEYAGLTSPDGSGEMVYLTGYAGMEHISAQAMIDFTQLATQTAWGRLAGHRSPLLAKYVAAETEAARLESLGEDTGFTQDELLAQFEADSSDADDAAETTPQPDNRAFADAAMGTDRQALTQDGGQGAFAGLSGLQSLTQTRSVGMQSGLMAANDVGAAEQTAAQTSQVDVLRQAIAGFGETGFGAMLGSAVLPDEDRTLLSARQRPALNAATYGRA